MRRQAQGRGRPRLDQAGPRKIVVNERTVEVYFARPVLRMLIQQPLSPRTATPIRHHLHGLGGGLRQAGAVRHGSPRRSPPTSPTCARVEARWIPDPRLARGRAQEIWPRQSPALVPVLQALRRSIGKTKGRSGALFYLAVLPRIRRPFADHCRYLTVFRPALSLYSRRIRQKGARLVNVRQSLFETPLGSRALPGMACSSASRVGANACSLTASRLRFRWTSGHCLSSPPASPRSWRLPAVRLDPGSHSCARLVGAAI